MNRLVASALASILLLAASLAQAAGLVSNVTITQIESLSGGQFFVYFSSPATGAAACVGNPNAFVLDSTTPAGKTLVSIFEVAYTQGSKITAGGTGACDVYSGYETVSYVITP